MTDSSAPPSEALCKAAAAVVSGVVGYYRASFACTGGAIITGAPAMMSLNPWFIGTSGLVGCGSAIHYDLKGNARMMHDVFEEVNEGCLGSLSDPASAVQSAHHSKGMGFD